MFYNSQTLIEYCNNNKIQIENKYKEVKINRDSYIEGNCIIEKCCNKFNKNFRQLVKTGAFCESCMKEVANNKIKLALVKFDNIMLEDFCRKNNIILLDDYTNAYINRNTIISGNCLTSNCDNKFKKTFRELLKLNGYCEFCSKENGKVKIKETNLKNYGVGCCLLSPEVKEKCKQTTLKKYGVEHNSQSLEIKNKKKEKSLEKYGVEHVLQYPEIRNKIKKTNLEKYGVENPQQNKVIKENTMKTTLKKYGVNSYSKTNEFKNKCIETSFKKYGVSHHSQNAIIADKMLKTAYNLKQYILPSGKIINYQGYENFALDDLLNVEKIDENDIITCRKEVPEIWYNDKNNKRHRHYVDFYIKSQNRCIEVKSTWTNQSKNNVLEKQTAAKDLGLNYEIWIYDKNGCKLKTLV
jgi:hypothetical protein